MATLEQIIGEVRALSWRKEQVASGVRQRVGATAAGPIVKAQLSHL